MIYITSVFLFTSLLIPTLFSNSTTFYCVIFKKFYSFSDIQLPHLKTIIIVPVKIMISAMWISESLRRSDEIAYIGAL